MNRLVLVLFFLFPLFVNAKTYYVSANGNDNNDGLSTSTPWKSLTKVQNSMSSFLPGDKILFRRGDVFVGTLSINVSGTSSNFITFGSYGTGENPIITGEKSLISWTQTTQNPNIWQASFTNSTITKGLFIQEVAQNIGRFPNIEATNKGYLKIDQSVGKKQLTDNDLPDAPNWTGAEVVIRSRRFILDRSKVISHLSGGQLNITESSMSETITPDYGYFFINHIQTLDQEGEWAHDNVAKKIYLYLSSQNPNNVSVKVSSANNVLNISSRKYVIVEGITFMRSVKDMIYIKGSDHITIRNCKIFYAGGRGVELTGDSDFCTIENNYISDSGVNGIDVASGCDDNTLIGNIIKRTGLMEGMGEGGPSPYTGIFASGLKTLIQYNQVDSSGYNGIGFNNDYIRILNNSVNYACLVKNDGACIYTYYPTNLSSSGFVGCKINHNIITNAYGESRGTATPEHILANGIFTDGFSQNIEIIGNSIGYCRFNGINLNNTEGMTVVGNTLFNNATQLMCRNDVDGKMMRRMTIQNNILATDWDEKNLAGFVLKSDEEIKNIGIIDQNYYVRPFKPYEYIFYNRNQTINGTTNRISDKYTVQQFQSIYQVDVASKSEPTAYSTFTINQHLSSNYTINGKFDTNINNWFYSVTSNQSNPNSTAGITHVTQNPLGKSMKVAFKTYSLPTNKITTFFKTEKSISKNAFYLLKFTVLGTKEDQNIEVGFRKTGDGYGFFAPSVQLPLSTSPKTYQVLFKAENSYSNGRVDFVVEERDSIVWLDDIEFHKVEATVNVELRGNVKFLTNPSREPLTISLDRPHIDVDGNLLLSSITLQPYTSAIILAVNLKKFWMEAECAAQIGSNWQTVIDTKASAGQYLEPKPGFNFMGASASPDPQNWVTYNLELTQSGNYKIFARVKTPSSGDDSFWFKIDNGTWLNWTENVLTKEFAWKQITSNTFFMSAGSHQIYFATREDGAQLDKLFLTLENETPSGLGEEDPFCCPPAGIPCDDGDPLTYNDVHDGSCNCQGTPPGSTEFWLEAECANEVGTLWQINTDTQSSNEKFVVVNGINSTSAAPENTEGYLTFELNVAQTGTYALYARTKSPTSADDSYWIRIDGGSWSLWSPKVSTNFIWGQINNTVTLTQGIHTLQIAYREDGAQLDKLHVKLTPATVPTGLGLVDNFCSSAQQTLAPISNASTTFWLEAECATQIGSTWQTFNNPLASNEKYLMVTGYNSTSSAPNSSEAYLSFEFEIAETGTYHVFGRTRTPSSSDDSFWVRIDAGNWILWSPKIASTFAWSEVMSSINLTQGNHTLQIAYREDGAELDKIYIELAPAAVPTDIGNIDPICNTTASLKSLVLEVDEKTAIIEENVYDFQVTPNPFNEEINITCNAEELKKAGEGIITVYDLRGVELFSQRIKSSENNKLSLHTQKLASGFYIVSLTIGDKIQYKKILKQ